MNVDRILAALNEEKVDFLLIGGMNFLLLHVPELTFDVDIWVRDSPPNLESLNHSLLALGAAWGPTESTWADVPSDFRWLLRQSVYCLTTQHGALDVFREVRGLEGRYSECRDRSMSTTTSAGIPFLGLSDEDMLTCQEVLPPADQKLSRMQRLREAIHHKNKS